MLMLLDLLSTAWFAGIAATIALRCRLNFVSVFLAATIASTGGGTTREFILASDTLFWLETPGYLIAISTAIVLAYIFRNTNSLPGVFVKMADSFTTAVFIVVGITAARDTNFNLLVCLLMGVLTGLGGGLLRQAIFNRRSLKYNKTNIIASSYAAMTGVVLVIFGVNLLITVVLLGLVHLSITSISTIARRRKQSEDRRGVGATRGLSGHFA